MEAAESARRILEVFSKSRKKKLISLRELAKRAGFAGAHIKDFKRGYNLLRRKGILKQRQSGWTSEKRGGKNNHPKSVILMADIYIVEDEAELFTDTHPNPEELEIADEETFEELVPIITLDEDLSYMSKPDYEASKKEKTRNFWLRKATEKEVRKLSKQ